MVAGVATLLLANTFLLGVGYQRHRDSLAAIEATEAQQASDQAERQKFEPLPDPPKLIERGNGVTKGEATPDWQPPVSFQGGILEAVFWASPDDIERECGPDVVACTITGDLRRPTALLPNPCTLSRLDWYELTLCHELGHANGWPGDHAGGHWAPIPRHPWPMRLPSGG